MVNRSTSSLTRRRSLLATPGMGTRNSPVDNRRTWNSWRTPHLEPQEEVKWQHQDMSRNSPRTKLDALDLAEEGRESPVPRARTPADMEYSHLGSLQLGSLRIANGEPSPAAETRSTWHNSHPASHTDDYFAPEYEDSPITMKTTRRRHHMRSKSAVQAPNPPLHRNLRISSDTRRAKTTSRYGAVPKPRTPERPQQWHHVQQIHYEEASPEPEPLRRLRVMNKSQDTLATMLDIQHTVPDGEPMPSPHLTQFHDEGFASDETVSIREAAIRILDAAIFCEPTTIEPGLDTPVLLSPGSSQEQQFDEKRPAPRAADSGYSSGGSFRTKDREAGKSGTTPTVSKKPSIATDLRQSDKDGSEKGDPNKFRASEKMLLVPGTRTSLDTAAAHENERATRVYVHGMKSPLARNPALPEDWNIDDLSVALKTPKTPKTPKPPKTPASSISQMSIDSKPPANKLLKKKKSVVQEPPVIQSCEPIPEGIIPTVPADVRKHFVRRLSGAPGMEYLTRTYPTKNHVNNEDEDVEPELPALEPIQFPEPSETPDSESRGRHHRRTASERPSSSRSVLRRSLSLFRRKTKPDTPESQPPLPDDHVLLNLGDTASSLGRSPYDAAALNTTHLRRTQTPTHPHQISDTMPRTKSLVQMDAQTATYTARLRSKDRAHLRPEMPPRPRSYYSEREAGSAADIYRRHSFYGHAPPMPTIPSIGNLGAAAASREVVPQLPCAEESPAEQAEHDQHSHRPHFRARSKGRGRVVTPLIEKFDQYDTSTSAPAPAPAVPTGSSSRTSTRDGRPSTFDQLNEAAKKNAGRSYSLGKKGRRKINHPDWG